MHYNIVNAAQVWATVAATSISFGSPENGLCSICGQINNPTLSHISHAELQYFNEFLFGPIFNYWKNFLKDTPLKSVEYYSISIILLRTLLLQKLVFYQLVNVLWNPKIYKYLS
jgi:hypothetical protein